jgi:hypothetical protein
MPLSLPPSFALAVERRQLLLFVGAGFSKNISADMPSWAEVIRKAAGLLDYDPDILETQGDYLQIAEYLRHKLVVVGSPAFFTRVPRTETGLLAHQCFTAYYQMCQAQGALFKQLSI